MNIKASFEILALNLSGLPLKPGMNHGLFKAQCVTLANEIKERGKRCKNLGPFSQAQLESFRELTSNDSVVIAEPDKGKGVVILNKVDYNKKLDQILADNNKFKLDIKQKDNTVKTEQKIKQLVLNLKNSEKIDNATFIKIMPSGSIIPRLYGKIKIHKNNAPARPVLSMTGSPMHELAKWIAALLREVISKTSIYSIKDSSDLISKLTQLDTQEKKLHMASIDVTSLYTSIPLHECINYVCDCINHFSCFPLPVCDLNEILITCTASVQFLCNRQYYHQVDGVAMGSPLGPILAEAFMNMIESKIANTINSQTIFYGRYVDDCVVIADDTNKINKTLDELNTLHDNVNFTIEWEKTTNFPF